MTNIEMYQWSNGKSRGTALVTVKNVEQTLDIVTRHNLEIDGWTVEPKMMLVSRSGVLYLCTWPVCLMHKQAQTLVAIQLVIRQAS